MGETSLWHPPSASTMAPAVDAIFNFVNYVSYVFFIGVLAAMVYFIVKYRRRSADDRPAPVVESKWLEISWIIVPTILVLVVFTWGFKVFVRLNVAPPDAYEIRVRGYQWNWQFTYPEGFTTSKNFTVPVNRPVRLLMDSQDVLHSFYIPAFRIKQDVLPNRYSAVWFEATQVGTYDLFCTEYCGTTHSGMIGKITVVDQDTYNAFVEAGGDVGGGTPEQKGRNLYANQGCAGCHSLDGSRLVGPSFKGLFGHDAQTDKGTVTVDENYLRESILQPSAQIVAGYPPAMPNNYSTLTADQVDNLIAFIKAQK